MLGPSARMGTGVTLALSLIVALVGCGVGSGAADKVSPSHEIASAFLDRDGTGWVVDAQGRLFVTPDTGNTWTELSPPVVPAGVGIAGDEIVVAHVETVNVKDWDAGHELQVAVSHDRGESWNVDRVALAGVPADAPFIAVQDTTVAILVPWQTSSNFSRGTLVFSSNENRWVAYEAPVAGKLALISADELWLAGGVMNSALYRTANGGRSWQEIALPEVSEFFTVDTPVAVSGYQRELMLTVSGDQPAAVLMASEDSGATWMQEESAAVLGPIEIGVRLVAARDATAWHVAQPRSPAIVSLMPHGVDTSTSAQGLAGTIVEWSMAESEVGWATVFIADCPRKLDCAPTTVLMRTRNAGAGWESLGA